MPKNEKTTDEDNKEEISGNKLPLKERLHWKIYRKFPKLIKYPNAKESLDFYHSKDTEENKRSCPGEDVSISLNCYWAVEFYTPTQAESLISSFRRLGWDKDDTHGMRNPALFVEKLRLQTYGGGTMDLGTLVPPGQSTFFLANGKNIALPKNVKYAHAQLFHLTSSIACITVSFAFEDGFTKTYEDALRNEYKTYLRPLSSGVSIMSPMLQKREKIVEIRQKIRSEIKHWFYKNLPGVFCESEADNNFPTCEFVSFENAEPFPENTDVAQGSRMWLGLLELDHSFNVWDSNDIAGLKFCWSILRDDRTNFHAGLTITKENLEKIDMNMYGERSPSAYIARLDREMSELMSRWSCLALLNFHEENIRKIRDSQNYKLSAKNSIKFLNNIRKLVSESMDIATLSPELIAFSKQELIFSRGEHSFVMPTTRSRSQNPIVFWEALGSEIRARSQQLIKIDKAIKELVIQQGNLLGTLENIKLQKSMRWLTLLIGAITIFLAYQAIPGDNLASFFVSMKAMMN